MQTVLIEGLRFFAYHGVTAPEQETGQEFRIDIEMSLERGADADDIGSTVDYAAVSSGVVEVATAARYDLLETLAERVLDYLMSFEMVSASTVTVFKADAPMPVEVDRVGVRASRARY